MRLCSYVVKRDRGLAPNPFWGYCTLAVCTPNHMGIRLMRGDWIAGFSDKASGGKLIYCMQVDEVLDFNQYYRDSRFDKKHPKRKGSPQQRVGDNIYFIDGNGRWQRDNEAVDPTDLRNIEKDIKHPCVFISTHFFYLGKKAVAIPAEFQSLRWLRQGVTMKHDPKLVEGFLEWVEHSYQPGCHALPTLSAEDAKYCSPGKPRTAVNRGGDCR